VTVVVILGRLGFGVGGTIMCTPLHLDAASDRGAVRQQPGVLADSNSPRANRAMVFTVVQGERACANVSSCCTQNMAISLLLKSQFVHDKTRIRMLRSGHVVRLDSETAYLDQEPPSRVTIGRPSDPKPNDEARNYKNKQTDY
jgi:hypothetical protein